MSTAKFWMVWRPGGYVPTVRHTSEAQANKEAERIAGLAPGEEVFVLEAKRVKKKISVETTELVEDTRLPF